jgi:cytochrome c oxidase subunit 4
MTDITLEPSDSSAPEAAAHDDAHAHGPTDRTFVVTFFVLAAITALEVILSYADVGIFFLPALLSLMLIKFFTVVLVFMHVKYDNKIFGRLFYIGLGLAVFVYLVALMTFRFFGS